MVLDPDGKRLLSRQVLNDEPELQDLLADVLAIDEDAVWAVDVADGMATLLINVLLNHGQQLLYIPGLAVNRASAGYRGMGKTDAKDATVIADQARMRRDLTILRPDDEQAIELRILTDRRSDLNADRTRRINRPCSQLASIFPALERAMDLGNVGPLILLTGYQTPAALRRTGRSRLETWLRNRKVRSAEALATAALEADERQHTAVPGEKITAQVIHTLAKEVMLDPRSRCCDDHLSSGCDPRSEWKITPVTSPPRVATAARRASVTSSARMWLAMDQPSTRREYMSTTQAR
ncbi:hypothetical protein GCM10010207_78520 [Streptomyces atratus]|nr:hypothetical protein GCM10010207_78520 [Streptomyces atratus]